MKKRKVVNVEFIGNLQITCEEVRTKKIRGGHQLLALAPFFVDIGNLHISCDGYHTKKRKEVRPLPELVPLLTKSDVTHYLNISSSQVSRLIKSGVLPTIKLGASSRYHPDDVRKAMLPNG